MGEWIIYFLSDIDVLNMKYEEKTRRKREEICVFVIFMAIKISCFFSLRLAQMFDAGENSNR